MADFKHIPGETQFDPTDIIRLPGEHVTRAMLVERETLAIYPVADKYQNGEMSIRTAPFTDVWMTHVHWEMFHTVYHSAGQTRQRNLNMGIPWHQVDVQLYELQRDIEAWANSDMPLIEQSARLHHRAVHIHPFLNGNGRWSRLLGNIWLWRHDQPYTDWPEKTIGDESEIRTEYIEVLKSADGGDYQPLFNLHRRYRDGD